MDLGAGVVKVNSEIHFEQMIYYYDSYHFVVDEYSQNN